MREMERWNELSRILSVLVLANQLRVVRGLLLVDAGKAGGNGEQARLVPRSMRRATTACGVFPVIRPIGWMLKCLVVLSCWPVTARGAP
jgi:hypothetical protein